MNNILPEIDAKYKFPCFIYKEGEGVIIDGYSLAIVTDIKDDWITVRYEEGGQERIRPGAFWDYFKK